MMNSVISHQTTFNITSSHIHARISNFDLHEKNPNKKTFPQFDEI